VPVRYAAILAPVRRWLHEIRPARADLRADALAGVPGAVSSVPDGMASAVLIGVNPVFGLYASFAGPLAGGLTSSTRMMVITTTTAASLAAGSALQGVAAEDRPEALFLLTLLAGVFMLAAGILRLGRYIRFVSHSVMIGFLSGVAVNIVAGQLPDLLGADADGPYALAKAVDVLLHPGRVYLPSLLAGASAVAILLLLARTRWALFSSLVAVAVPTVVVLLAGARDVATVADVGDIPRGVPLPHLPDLSMLSPALLLGAVSVAAIVLVQGAGVAEAAPNPDGTRSDANRDFVAQGIANLAAGLFRGQPVGGSVGQTALNMTAGARSRWGSVWCGLWMLLILAALSGIVGRVALPTLAAVLIVAGLGSLRPTQLLLILRTGRVSQIAAVSTFLATLFLPVAAAVGTGVVISLLLQLNREALDLAVVRLVPDGHGHLVEEPAPTKLAGGQVTVLDVYGSLLYAGARTLQARLPDPTGSAGPVVVLRLRGRMSLGATFFAVLTDYARRLAAADGALYLSGVGPELAETLRRTGQVHVDGPLRIFDAEPPIGESTTEAYTAASAWMVRPRADGSSPS
jgi:sulfate permease, SulP family